MLFEPHLLYRRGRKPLVHSEAFVFNVCECFAYLYTGILCVQYLKMPEGVGSPGTWVTYGCEPLLVLKIKPGSSLPRQLLTPEPPLQSPGNPFIRAPSFVRGLQRSSLTCIGHWVQACVHEGVSGPRLLCVCVCVYACVHTLLCSGVYQGSTVATSVSAYI